LRGRLRYPGDPMWRQFVPDVLELEDSEGQEDPLAEEPCSPVPNLVHRYPDRALWLVSTRCAAHCRFCTRKRRWLHPVPMTRALKTAALDYIAAERGVRDVLLSGGDPLLLGQRTLEGYLRALRRIGHVEIIRIGTRIPVALPARVTAALASSLGCYHPLYVNLHINHPWELTPETRHAVALLADAGIPLGSQTVLLRGVNDDERVLEELFRSLLALRVRPYYLLQMDLMRSTAHFRTPVATGLEIVAALHRRLSGMALPQYVIDLPGGRGKVPLLPTTSARVTPGALIFDDDRGEPVSYPLVPGEAARLRRLLTG
jgi:lysine 2,3-aminomutase